ncbi:MAG: 3-isopropylmalate dehydratase small subunit [Candidatus Micrarchaeia archaeon]
MLKKISGRVYRCGDNIDTDVIIPARYLNITEPSELAKHAMEDLDTDFAKKPHDIVVAGENFGCGSSREHAPIALKASGVKAVIARSFARIFFRNAINIGLPVIMCEMAGEIGESAEIDFERGEIRSGGKVIRFGKFDRSVEEIISAGGLVEMLKAKLKGGEKKACARQNKKHSRSTD